MKKVWRRSHWARLLACLVLVGLLLGVCRAIVQVNATTAGLLFVLLVLAVATRWGIREAVWTSLLSVLSFNFFFLPPIGTFTIADPQNWVALTVFLITAITAGQLSERARRRTQEALERRGEVERLYEMSRSMLLADTRDLLTSSVRIVPHIFHLDHAVLFESATSRFYGSLQDAPFTAKDLEQAAADRIALTGRDFFIEPVLLGTRPAGSMGFSGRHISKAERDAIANLMAISLARAEALEQAAQAEAAKLSAQLKTSVLDGIAHDLKTPLTAIKTCVSTLITIPPRTEEKRSELLTIIDEETDHLKETVNSAIQLARFEARNFELNWRRVDLRTLLESAAAPFLSQRQIHIAADSGWIEADPALLEAALKQALENALKYTPPDMPVEIEGRRGTAETTIAVLDHGPGFEPSETGLVFEKFYRGRRARAESEGSGLGLAIARGIVEAHGGVVSAENRPEGGAAVRITLPLRHERSHHSGD